MLTAQAYLQLSNLSFQLVSSYYKTKHHVGSSFIFGIAFVKFRMEKLRLSFIFLVALGFLCTVDSNPISSLFGKSDDKAEADDKEAVTAAKSAGDATTTTTTTTTTTATPEPSSSCGGIKGFLHLCEKSEPTEPPKSVKVRSVPEEEGSDESDSDSDEDSKEEEEKKKEVTQTPSSASESTEGVAKRQVGDPEAPVLGEIPPVLGDAMSPPVEPSEEEDGGMEKRQTDDSSSEEKSDEAMEVSRQRRDCRDRDGDYDKDCRKKREYVPCLGSHCGEAEATTKNQLK